MAGRNSGKVPGRPIAFYVGVALLAIQVALVVFARFHPMRYYCWAPYDAQNEYRIAVTLRGCELSADAVAKRYRIRPEGVNPRSIYEVYNVVSFVERVYRPDDAAEVVITYRTNGGKEQTWRLP